MRFVIQAAKLQKLFERAKFDLRVGGYKIQWYGIETS